MSAMLLSDIVGIGVHPAVHNTDAPVRRGGEDGVVGHGDHCLAQFVGQVPEDLADVITGH